MKHCDCVLIDARILQTTNPRFGGPNVIVQNHQFQVQPVLPAWWWWSGRVVECVWCCVLSTQNIANLDPSLAVAAACRGSDCGDQIKQPAVAAAAAGFSSSSKLLVTHLLRAYLVASNAGAGIGSYPWCVRGQGRYVCLCFWVVSLPFWRAFFALITVYVKWNKSRQHNGGTTQR